MQLSFGQGVHELLEKLTHSTSDSDRVKLQIALADYYSYKPGSQKQDYDSAGFYIEAAQRIAYRKATRAVPVPGDEDGSIFGS